MVFQGKRLYEKKIDGTLSIMERHITGISASLQEFICDGTPESVCRRYGSLKEAAKAADFGIFSDNVVVIDTETTGLSYNHDDLIQIAAARMKGGKIISWFNTFVDPGKAIPEEIVHLTHISQEDIAGAPTPNEALSQLVEFVGDALCVAHNAEFDRTFTTKHPAGYPLLENTWIDSLDLARIALPCLKSHRLLDLVRAFDAPLSTHRADADVEATCAVFPLLLAAVQAMPAALVNLISQFATQKDWQTQVVFEYFNKKNQEEAAAREESVPSFSLRSIRRQTIGSFDLKPRPDAERLAEDPIVGIKAPSQKEIANAFTEEGLVGSLYDQFESREEQCLMSCAVAKAFQRSENLVVEAGTGVGKSMAYLLPASLLARKNHITVGVATKTNALLDQLIYHELPLLGKALGGLSYAALKGFSHYPCLRKIEHLVAEHQFERTLGDKKTTCAVAVAALLSYIEQSDYSDIDTLKIDYRLLPRRSITSTSQECLRRKCPYYGASCFVHGSRRKASAADIVVTNHSLLFCDIAAEGGLLPPIRYWVVDEAHGAEQEARKAFSRKLASDELLNIARKVSADDSRNVFSRIQRRASARQSESQENLLYALTGKALSAGKEFDQAVQAYVPQVKELLYYDTARNKSYEFVDLWINEEVRDGRRFQELSDKATLVQNTSEKLICACQELVVYLEDDEGAVALQREVAVIALSLRDVVDVCESIFSKPSDAFAYSATLSHKKDRFVDRVEALPLNMGSMLEEAFYQRTYSVVYASATVAVGESFEAFEHAMGLNESEASQTNELKLASSFDFDRNMTIYVPNDMPEPSERSYLAHLQKLLIAAHLAQNGSMLTLFTNRREMEACFDAVNPQLKEADLRLVCQKWGLSVKGLRDEFLSDKQVSLFALKSFWEGFDAPGSTLRGVIVPKLPFAKPTDPLSRERSTRDADAWRHYVLPAAVIEMKQAAGRLIRTHDDQGILILADRRLLTKSYGKTFLRSMPSANVKIMSCAEIAEDIRKSQV